MLDPFTALSIAASVVQFVDFSSRLLSKANEIRKDGKTIEVAHLRVKIEDLILISAGLRLRPGDRDASIRAQDEALDRIAIGCANISDELIRTLNRLSRADGGRWSSIRAALQTVWKAEKIDALTKQLDEYRQQLSLRLLMLLNTKNDQQSSVNDNRLRSLENSNQRIVEIVTFTQSLLEAALAPGKDNEYARTIAQYVKSLRRAEGDSSEAAPQRLCEEALSAIITFEDGSSRTIADLSRPSLQSNKTLQKRSLHRVTTFRDESKSLTNGGISTYEFAPLAKRILYNLHFRMINVRIDSVADTHQNTFKWIFEEHREPRPWDNFVDWLRYRNGCYWINGKAGSGKSTLMKSIVLNKLTKKHLQQWAGGRQLIQASFFFWAPGTQLQKSQEGLLRGLLTDILKQCPYLIPNVFPDLSRDIANAGNPENVIDSNFSTAELKSAFRRLLECSRGFLKLCLFIDGLDEYSGDHADICTFLKDISFSRDSRSRW